MRRRSIPDTPRSCYFTNPEAAQFASGFHAKYSVLEGDEWSIFAYDAANIVAAAMERAKSTDGAKVIPEMFKLDTIKGASGTFKITPNGEIDTVVFVGTWGSDGKVKIIRSWKPPNLE